MKFSDIDFSAISRMMDNMSDEEKASLNDMAQNMMDNMNNQNAEVEEETDMYEALRIDEQDYSDLPGNVLDQIEAAVDLESYYEDTKDVDFSASILFYSKAVLTMCRDYLYPIFKNVLEAPNFSNKDVTTLYNYYYPLTQEENLHKLVDEGFGDSITLINLRDLLSQLYILLNRAEYDFVSYEDVQVIKDKLFKDKGLLNISNLTK